MIFNNSVVQSSLSYTYFSQEKKMGRMGNGEEEDERMVTHSR